MIERRQLRVPVDDILGGVAALAATIIDPDRCGDPKTRDASSRS